MPVCNSCRCYPIADKVSLDQSKLSGTRIGTEPGAIGRILCLFVFVFGAVALYRGTQ